MQHVICNDERLNFVTIDKSVTSACDVCYVLYTTELYKVIDFAEIYVCSYINCILSVLGIGIGNSQTPR